MKFILSQTLVSTFILLFGTANVALAADSDSELVRCQRSDLASEVYILSGTPQSGAYANLILHSQSDEGVPGQDVTRATYVAPLLSLKKSGATASHLSFKSSANPFQILPADPHAPACKEAAFVSAFMFNYQGTCIRYGDMGNRDPSMVDRCATDKDINDYLDRTGHPKRCIIYQDLGESGARAQECVGWSELEKTHPDWLKQAERRQASPDGCKSVHTRNDLDYKNPNYLEGNHTWPAENVDVEVDLQHGTGVLQTLWNHFDGSTAFHTVQLVCKSNLK